MGHTVVKPNAKKVRRINDTILAGFAGSTADAFTLMERLESKLEEHPGNFTVRLHQNLIREIARATYSGVCGTSKELAYGQILTAFRSMMNWFMRSSSL